MTRRMGVRAIGAAVALAALVPVAGATAATTSPIGVRIVGSTQLTTVEKPLLLEDTGTVKGNPVGSGNITLNYRLIPSASTARVTWTITNAKGSLSGTATARYTTTNLAITFAGRGAISKGTGAYRGLRATRLQFNAKHSKTGKKEAISFLGTATRKR
jgi:hypothetical protein